MGIIITSLSHCEEPPVFVCTVTAQKIKFSITDSFSKCDQSFLRIWSNLLEKSVMENFIFMQCVWLAPSLSLVRLFRSKGWKNLLGEVWVINSSVKSSISTKIFNSDVLYIILGRIFMLFAWKLFSLFAI